jgi:hypothetical protein
LSVGEVVVEADPLVVVVVVTRPVPRVDVLVEVGAAVVDVVLVAPAPEEPAAPVGAVVVVVVAAGGGATKGTVSACMVVRLVAGVTLRLVQPRAEFQLWTAAVAAEPLKGWGSPLRMLAGRQTAPVMWRPCAVMINEPLSVSGGVLS